MKSITSLGSRTGLIVVTLCGSLAVGCGGKENKENKEGKGKKAEPAAMAAAAPAAAAPAAAAPAAAAPAAAAPAAPAAAEGAAIATLATEEGGKAALGRRVSVTGTVYEVAERELGGKAMFGVVLEEKAEGGSRSELYCFVPSEPKLAAGQRATAVGVVAQDGLYGTILTGCQVSAAAGG